MTEPVSAEALEALPEPALEKPPRWRPSLVWMVPVLAALIGLSLVVHALMQRGPTITVSFASAEGIEPGKTKVKYREVDIGEVKAARLAKDRTHVVVTIELVKEASHFAVADTRFWVVRPRLAGPNISGLSTLLSGAYIGVDAGRSEDEQSEYTGLENPPIVASDVPGHRFLLRAQDIGSLDVGSPVYFRRVQVGHVESYQFEPNGQHIAVGVFVKAPYDHFVSANTRFWHASGIDVRVDAGGLKLQTQSLSTIVLGGIAFENVGGAATPPAADGSEFLLAADHDEAVRVPDGKPQPAILRFRQSVRGLAVGAPVDFRGVEIGIVRSVGLAFDAKSGEFYAPVLVDLFPERFAAKYPSLRMDDATQQATRDAELVRHGLRAQLRSGNLLTGQRYIALDFFPHAPPAQVSARNGTMEIPTVAGDVEELQAQLQSIVRKLDKVPFDTLGDDAHRALVSVDTTVRHVDALVQRADKDVLPELKASLKDLRSTLDAAQAALREAQSTLSPDSPLQQDTRAAMQGVAEATRSLKALTDALERHPESLLQGKKGGQP